MSTLAVVGIRREDKGFWERRAPLAPDDVGRLVREHGLNVLVQRSERRLFGEADYAAAGATIVDDLGGAQIILGVKEIPPAKLEPEKTYLYFSHTIKGQPANMPMLRRLLELRCTLIDYERITDAQGRRLVFFGRYAGLAGMIDALWALGQRLRHENIPNPFETIKRAYDYPDIRAAKEAVAAAGGRIAREGLPRAIQPFLCGFSGYGNVSQGAQEIFDQLPVCELSPDELGRRQPGPHECGKVVFREEHMVERVDAPVAASQGTAPGAPGAGAQGTVPGAPCAAVPGGAVGQFDLQDYYTHPERYRGRFFAYVPHLTMLMNCIYWDARYPRLITKAQVQELFAGGPQRPKLRVIGDLSCDIDGSIECTVRPCDPGDPVYVYEPRTGAARSGVAGDGPVILAVDILPAELPADATAYFGQALSPFLPALARAHLCRPFDQAAMAPELRRATIVYRGELTPPYRYLETKVR